MHLQQIGRHGFRLDRQMHCSWLVHRRRDVAPLAGSCGVAILVPARALTAGKRIVRTMLRRHLNGPSGEEHVSDKEGRILKDKVRKILF